MLHYIFDSDLSSSKCLIQRSKPCESSTYSVGPSYTWRPVVQETSLRFPFKLPRFQQLPTVYIITLRRVIWLFPGEMKLLLCLWSPEPPPLCSSVTAPAYSQSQTGGALVVSGGSGARFSNGTELGRNKRDGRSSTHTVNHICINA